MSNNNETTLILVYYGGGILLACLGFLVSAWIYPEDKDVLEKAKLASSIRSKVPKSQSSGETNKKNDNNVNTSTNTITSSTTDQSKKTKDPSQQNGKTDWKHGNNTTEEWVGNQIPPEKLEMIRKTLHLTKEQMDQVMTTSRQEALKDETTEGNSSLSLSSNWTPHQILNSVVYLILFTILIFVINRDYDNIVYYWFVQTFPTESKVFGWIA